MLIICEIDLQRTSSLVTYLLVILLVEKQTKTPTDLLFNQSSNAMSTGCHLQVYVVRTVVRSYGYTCGRRRLYSPKAITCSYHRAGPGFARTIARVLKLSQANVI